MTCTRRCQIDYAACADVAGDEAGEVGSGEPRRPAMSSRWLDADLEEDPNADEVGKVRTLYAQLDVVGLSLQ